MLKSGKYVSVFLAIIMLLSIGCVGAAAGNIDIPVTKDTLLCTFSSSSGSDSILFSIPDGEPYLKIWCDNRTACMDTVELYSPSGELIGYNKMAPYTSCTIYGNGPLPAGKYSVKLSSKNKYQLRGSMAVKTADTEDGLDID